MKLEQLKEVVKSAVDPDPKITKWLRDVANYDYHYTLKGGKIFLANGGRIEIFDDHKLKDLPYSFGGEVSFFSSNNNYLSSFESFPKNITGTLNISYNKFTTFEGMPIVGLSIVADVNLISSFKGIQAWVHDDLFVSNNKITSFQYCPKQIDGSFFIEHNLIESIEHAPERIGRSCWLNDNKITSLKDIHKHIKYIGGKLDVSGNPITSNILGVILIDSLEDVVATGLTSSKLYKAVKIVNKYLGKGKAGVLEAQQELIENDLEDFAEL